MGLETQIMDKKSLEERLRELNLYSEYYHRLELKILSSLLPYDEKLYCIFTGIYKGTRVLVAVTDYRIIIVSSGVLAQTNVTVIKRSSVSSFKFNRKFLFSSVLIKAGEETYEFLQVQGKREKLFNQAMQMPVKQYAE